MSKVGFVCLLICILLSLLLHGSSASRGFPDNHGNKGLAAPEYKATMMIKAEEVEEKTNVKAEKENIIDGRELIFNVDYHGATTHPPTPPGSGHRN